MTDSPYGEEHVHDLDVIDNAVRSFLTDERAKIVRVLRVDCGSTWRWVAERIAYIFPDSGIVGGHQLYGESLCRQAATLLNEDPNNTPWN